MLSPNTHVEIKNAILLLALDSCFLESEIVLAAEQIAVRKLTPNDGYSYRCIANLLELKLIDVEHIPSVLGPNLRKYDTLAIRKPSLNVNLGCGRISIINNIALAIQNSSTNRLFFQKLYNELIACECISYAEYYSRREGLEIINASPYDKNIQALIMEISREQVFMLLWRAIKSYSKAVGKAPSDVSFNALTTMSVSYYEGYCVRNVIIDSYEWPSSITLSKLSLTLKKIESLI